MEATPQAVLCMLWGDMVMHEEGAVTFVDFQNHISEHIQLKQVKFVRLFNKGLIKLVLSKERVWCVQSFSR